MSVLFVSSVGWNDQSHVGTITYELPTARAAPSRDVAWLQRSFIRWLNAGDKPKDEAEREVKFFIFEARQIHEAGELNASSHITRLSGAGVPEESGHMCRE